MIHQLWKRRKGEEGGRRIPRPTGDNGVIGHVISGVVS